MTHKPTNLSPHPPFNVAHVCLSAGWGGLEMYSITIHQIFRHYGHSGIHICLNDTPLQRRLAEKNLPYICLDSESYFSPKNILAMRKMINSHNINVIFTHVLRNLWFIRPSLVNMPRRDPHLVGFAHMFLKNIRKKDIVHSWLYKRVNTLISLTNIQKQGLLDCLPVSPEQIVTIPNGLNLSIFQAITNDQKHKTITVIGRIDPHKGQEELIQAFLRLHKDHPDWKLYIIGRGVDQGGKSFEQRLKQQYNHPKIIFTGHQEDISPWLAQTSIFVMPSYEETFGLVLIEAMAAGCPCIATNSGGVPEILPSDHSKGQLVAPKSAESIYQALKTYITNPELAQQVGLAARQYVTQKYDIHAVYEKIYQCLTK